MSDLLFYQIFSRIFKYKGESFLATVSCMKRKLRAHYDAENEFIIKTFPNWHPLHGMADAEKAMRSSAQQYHDGLVVKICKFHVCQAIVQKNKSLGFTVFFKTKKSFSTWLRKIMAVPLLPPHLMGAMYDELLTQTFNFTFLPRYRQFEKFKTYIRSTWASQNFEELSVFGLEDATNNISESFNSRFNDLVKKKHPTPYHFVIALNEMLGIQKIRYQALKANPEIPVVKPRSSRLQAYMAKLRQSERLLLQGHLTPMQFIERHCHSVDGVIERAIGTEIGEDEEYVEDPEDTIREDEEIIRRVNPDVPICFSCELVCEEKFVFQCGCQQFCNICSDNVMQQSQENRMCPKCHQDARLVINLH